MADGAPRVRVNEVTQTTQQIRGVPTSVGAMLGRLPKGWTSRSVKVTSESQFTRIFGFDDGNSYMQRSVKDFFTNAAAGGLSAELWIKRILGSSGGGAANTKASVVVGNSALTASATFTAAGEGPSGNAFRVLVVKEDVVLGKILGTTLAAGAQTEAVLVAGAVSRIQVGDTLKLVDGAVTSRIVVRYIRGNTIVFETSNTVAVGGLNAATTVITNETFSVSVFDGQQQTMAQIRGLRYSPLSLRNYFLARINTTADEVPVTAASSALAYSNAVDPRPVSVDQTSGSGFAGGDEFTTFADVDYIGSSGAGTGFYSLDRRKDIRIIAVPGVTGLTAGAVSKGLIDYCEFRQDCVAVVPFPLGTSPSAAITYKTNNLGSSSYYAAFYNWIEVLDELTGLPAYQSPEGFVMGCWARTDSTRGISKAPAGEVDGLCIGGRGVERDLSEGERDSLYNENINLIEKLDNGNVCLMGSRTAERGTQFEQIHVRRTYIYLRISLQRGTSFMLFEPNDSIGRQKAKKTIDGFLRSEYKKGTLTGADEDEAWSCICDESNNQLETRKAQRMRADVAVNIPDTTERLDIYLGPRDQVVTT